MTVKYFLLYYVISKSLIDNNSLISNLVIMNPYNCKRKLKTKNQDSQKMITKYLPSYYIIIKELNILIFTS